jgi:hypothetical protein
MPDQNGNYPPETDAFAAQEPVMSREPPRPAPAREQAVTRWQDRARRAREYWTANAFLRMVEDMRFAAGKQWPNHSPSVVDPVEMRYVANITLRHIRQRTASLYGKNPRIVARRKARLLNTVWDGTQVALEQANAMMQMVQDASAMGMAPPIELMQMVQGAQAIVADEASVRAQNVQLDRVAKTLELLFEHEISEQPLNFKVQMKAVVRRALTTGVGYAKLGYLRVMELPPEVELHVADLAARIARVEQIAADRADGEILEDHPDADTLQIMVQELAEAQATDQIIVREGLTISYPDSTALIPSTGCRQLRGFVGCDWVAEEFYLTTDQIKRVYQKDVGASVNSHGEQVTPRAYTRGNHLEFRPTDSGANTHEDHTFHCVWEIYSKEDGLVYVVCDGYPDYLVEPGAPDVALDGFYPWFVFAVNEVCDDNTIFPFSDVRLMRDMQLDLNVARQGLREHRRASRPQMVARKGVLTELDKEKLQNRQPFEVIELQALDQGMKISEVLDPLPHPGVDPNLYDTSPVFEDYLRTLGQNEANLGGTSGSTATEAAIAEGSRNSDVSSTVDDLDEFLTEIARAAGQILLAEASPEKVKELVGPGAVWPTLSASEVSREIFLDVEAASTGRPNRAAELQAAQTAFPMLMQLPKINPEFLARELLRRMDDRLDLHDAFLPGAPSIQQMNGPGGGMPGGAGPAGPQSDPRAQGGQGGNNAPSTRPPQVNAAPRPPQESMPAPTPGAGGI